MRLFAPGMALMGRLRMSRKLAVLALLFMLPLSICLYAILSDEVNVYTSTRDELDGIRLLETSQALLKAVQKRRGASASLMAGSPSIRPAFDAANAESQRLIATLREQAAATRRFDLTAQTDALAAQYAQLAQMPLSGPGKDVFDAHTALVRAIFAFTADLADASQLALDPQAVTYYLANSVALSLPSAAEMAAIARGKGAAALSQGQLSAADRGALGVHATFLRDQIDTVRHDLKRVQHALGSMDGATLVQSVNFDNFDAFGNTVASLASNPNAPLPESNAYFDAGTRAVDAVYRAHGQLSGLLKSLLAARERAQAAHIAVLSVLSAASVSVALYLFIAFARRTGDDVNDIAGSMTQASAGDLRGRLDVSGRDELASIKLRLNELLASLNRTIVTTKASAESVLTGSEEIASGNLDLSRRTEEQAASLEQTAASMEELTATVRHNADNAKQAGALSREASTKASASGEVITRAVGVMHEIGKRSTDMAAMISTIEGIAFQTNILALNAAVEAARAGEQGKGFAVVAGEVRTLAHRTATAAKDVKEMIERSSSSVEGGTRLFHDAQAAIRSVIESVTNVDAIVNEIAGASLQQGEGIEQVNIAITQLDRTTQQNAALVEQAAAASASLKEQALRMEEVVATFHVDV
ncbi:methyl-accepting chemotaxis protein [Paraburkholderia rhizosphaerae]|uniref:Methyl-accepting chemotaxis protein-1 (Serine sensor receptor) n=1 Tax=Paraburkholderia rhizosphaerae TaxID=480658 RepID=A0A4R8L5H1_9BURK|nr:methyl-accepting chemotaxis protein [Paraburkholderia rhizosphaerae]TDY37030.1 methyl-accepting chemotaxis protein-1 (serine sensor receptor) [Paraburkholderia rhizosphaerae]